MPRCVSATDFERGWGATPRRLPPGYRPRDPESSPLHKAVRAHKATFLEQMRARTAHGLPRYAERELDKYLRCGVL